MTWFRLSVACAATTALALGLQSGERVLISQDQSSEIAGHRCFAGTPARAITDNEAYAAVDPTSANRVVTVWQSQSGGSSVVQWAQSADAGRTWSSPRIAPTNTCAGGPVAGAARTSDPWVAFGPTGALYIAAIAWQPGSRGDDSISALVVVASADGGRNWGQPVAAAVAPAGVAHDNVAITADPTRPSTLYLATTRAETPDSATYYGRLGFTRSDDGGTTWAPIRPLTPAVNQERIGAPQIVVDPRSGRLYAVFHRAGPGGSFVGTMSSDDRGETWSEVVSAAPHVRGPRLVTPGSQRRFVIADDIVQAVVAPRTGQLVIAYADGSAAAGTHFGISVVISPDGRRWSAPRRVSSGLDEAWLPAVAVTPSNEIGVSYFAARFGLPADSSEMRLVHHRFGLAGDAMREAEQVTVDRFRLFWPGDYQGLVAAQGGFISAYGRGGDIYVTRRH